MHSIQLSKQQLEYLVECVDEAIDSVNSAVRFDEDEEAFLLRLKDTLCQAVTA